MKGKVALTPSKSLSNRFLMIRALSPQSFEIENLSPSSDTRIFESLLLHPRNVMDAQDAGTAYRFLTAWLAITPGTFLLTGTDRMKQRPIRPLVSALQQMGADISYAGQDGFPPLSIRGKSLEGGSVKIDGSLSSQFISALVMIGPSLERGLDVELTGKPSSVPYIRMTLSLMKRFGVQSEHNHSHIRIKSQTYSPSPVRVESDWSSAAFWFEVAALSDSAEFFLEGLVPDSLQGDACISAWMVHLGVNSEWNEKGVRIYKQKDFKSNAPLEFDFTESPDLFLPVLCACVGQGREGLFLGLDNLRYKESDRVEAILEELLKIYPGMSYQRDEHSLELLASGPAQQPFRLCSHSDHRIAMSLAPLVLGVGDFELDDETVVRKSYPEFWDQLSATGFKLEYLP